MSPSTNDDAWQLLQLVEDPEIPVLNVVEMGIVRDVQVTEDQLEVAITPTYSGCPAMDAIADAIRQKLGEAFSLPVVVKTVFQPAWTTDWMTDEARRKLKEYGIAPPKTKPCGSPKKPWMEEPDNASCPFCNASETSLTSAFGSTACKSLHYCHACHQPFEHFKCI